MPSYSFMNTMKRGNSKRKTGVIVKQKLEEERSFIGGMKNPCKENQNKAQ